jgi:hypothetical protein
LGAISGRVLISRRIELRRSSPDGELSNRTPSVKMQDRTWWHQGMLSSLSPSHADTWPPSSRLPRDLSTPGLDSWTGTAFFVTGPRRGGARAYTQLLRANRILGRSAPCRDLTEGPVRQAWSAGVFEDWRAHHACRVGACASLGGTRGAVALSLLLCALLSE